MTEVTPPPPRLSTRALATLSAAVLLLVVAIACGYLFWVEATPAPWAMLLAAAILLIASAWFAVASVYADSRVAATLAFPDTVNLAAAKSQDLRRDFNRAISAAEDMQAVVRREASIVQIVTADLARAQEASASEAEVRLSAEIAERNRAEALLRQWQDRTLEVVRGAERLLSVDGIDPTYAEGAEKVLSSLERQLGPAGLVVIRPQLGDEFDDLLHQVVASEDHSSVEAGRVLRAVSWGVVAGDQRERARVVIVRRAEPDMEAEAETAVDAVSEGANGV